MTSRRNDITARLDRPESGTNESHAYWGRTAPGANERPASGVSFAGLRKDGRIGPSLKPTDSRGPIARALHTLDEGQSSPGFPSRLDVKLEETSRVHDIAILQSFLADEYGRNVVNQFTLLSERMKKGHEKFLNQANVKKQWIPALDVQKRQALMRMLVNKSSVADEFSTLIASNCDAILLAALQPVDKEGLAQSPLSAEEVYTVLQGIKTAFDLVDPQH